MNNMKDINGNELLDCAGCTDQRSEGTHSMHTKQHPCTEGGDPKCGSCFPEIMTKNKTKDWIEEKVRDLCKAPNSVPKSQARRTLQECYEAGREMERDSIARLLSKAGENKISILNNTDDFTGTYWISLNNAYFLLTGRQINHDWEKGKLEKNAIVETLIRQTLTQKD